MLVNPLKGKVWTSQRRTNFLLTSNSMINYFKIFFLKTWVTKRNRSQRKRSKRIVKSNDVPLNKNILVKLKLLIIQLIISTWRRRREGITTIRSHITIKNKKMKGRKRKTSKMKSLRDLTFSPLTNSFISWRKSMTAWPVKHLKTFQLWTNLQWSLF